MPLNLQMSIAHEGNWPDQDEWRVKGLPGLIGPHFSEHNQRGMYRRWTELLAEEGK